MHTEETLNNKILFKLNNKTLAEIKSNDLDSPLHNKAACKFVQV